MYNKSRWNWNVLCSKKPEAGLGERGVFQNFREISNMLKALNKKKPCWDVIFASIHLSIHEN